VAFLIADFGGDALIRLGHAGASPTSRSQGRETADRVPLSGTPQGRALAGQSVEVEASAPLVNSENAPSGRRSRPRWSKTCRATGALR